MMMTKAVGVVCVMLGVAAMLCVAAEPAKQGDPKRESKAKQVASAWFESLMRGDTAVTTALSDVPFAMDRKQTIESISELEKMLEAVVAKKGKRDIKPTTSKIGSDEKEIKSDAFPSDHIIVHLMIGDEGVTLCVKPGDTFKVIGLSD